MFQELYNRSIFITLSILSLILLYYDFKEIILFSLCSYIKACFIYTNIKEVLYLYASLGLFIIGNSFKFICLFHLAIISISICSVTLYFNLKFFLFFNFICFSIFLVIFSFIVFPLSCAFFLNFHNILVFNLLNFYFEAQLLSYFDLYYYLYTFFALHIQLVLFFFIFLFLFFQTVNNFYLQLYNIRKKCYFFFVLISSIVTNSLEFYILILLLFCLFEIVAFFFLAYAKSSI